MKNVSQGFQAFRIAMPVKALFSFLIIMLVGVGSAVAQTQGAQGAGEINTNLIAFWNDVLLPLISLIMHILMVLGFAGAASYAFMGNPKWKMFLVGAMVAVVIWYGGGLIMGDLLQGFGSDYTIQ